jgi:(p)ppGpp synthase/HD superfamily hydrolase
MIERVKLGERFTEALLYARQLHAAQYRKGSGVPYLAHLLGVTALVLEDGGSENEAIAALLHDAVEDQGGRAVLEQIRLRFGPAVAELVQELSDSDGMPQKPWRTRKEAYLQRLWSASPAVRRVSLADKLHNARALLQSLDLAGEAVWERFRGGKVGTLWYYRSLADLFAQTGQDYMALELRRVVDEIEARAAR